jgi:hypothetical protein
MEEIVLDDVTLVPKADDEILYPVMSINFHDVPEDGLVAYVDHGFGDDR